MKILFIITSLVFGSVMAHADEVCRIGTNNNMFTALCTDQKANMIGPRLEVVMKSLLDQGYTQVISSPFGIILIQPKGNASTTSTSTTSSCPAGLVMTSRGCLPQGICPTGYGFLESANSCVQ